jgi:hypothetical protein
MAPTAHLVSTFNGFAKIHFEEQVVVVGTQQSRQADKAVGGCLLCFVPATTPRSSKWIFTV